MDVSVILPVINERENLSVLIPRLKAVLEREGLNYEIVVIDGNSTDGTREAAAAMGARVVPERRRGYAGAMMTGFAEAKGAYLLTLDADLSHDPDFFPGMWRGRTRGDIVIASRYVRGGVTCNSFVREKLSDLLNWAFRHALAIPVGDLSSGFRLYRREAVENLEIESRNFEFQEEVLARAYANGFSIVEVPFTYFPRGAGSSHARILRFGIDLACCAIKLRKIRNSPASADYEERLFYSSRLLERRWLRRRRQIIVGWARGAERILDAGCGSSVIVQSLNNPVAMDVSLAKLRFLRQHGMALVQGGVLALPFRGGSFDCLISSRVIEHLPCDETLFAEMHRVLRPRGTLILGTYDDSARGWLTGEPLRKLLAPSGYRGPQATRYTRRTLEEIVLRHGFAIEDSEYVAGVELILKCRKVEIGHNMATDASAEPTSRPSSGGRRRASSLIEAHDCDLATLHGKPPRCVNLPSGFIP